MRLAGKTEGDPLLIKESDQGEEGAGVLLWRSTGAALYIFNTFATHGGAAHDDVCGPRAAVRIKLE